MGLALYPTLEHFGLWQVLSSSLPDVWGDVLRPNLVWFYWGLRSTLPQGRGGLGTIVSVQCPCLIICNFDGWQSRCRRDGAGLQEYLEGRPRGIIYAQVCWKLSLAWDQRAIPRAGTWSKRSLTLIKPLRHCKQRMCCIVPSLLTHCTISLKMNLLQFSLTGWLTGSLPPDRYLLNSVGWLN